MSKPKQAEQFLAATQTLGVEFPGFRGEFNQEKLTRWKQRVVKPAYAAKVADVEAKYKAREREYKKQNHPDRYPTLTEQLAAQQQIKEHCHTLDRQRKAELEPLEEAHGLLMGMVWQEKKVDPPKAPPPKATPPPAPSPAPDQFEVNVIIVVNGVPMRRRPATADLSDAIKRFLRPLLNDL